MKNHPYTLDEIRAIFMTAVVNYLVDVCRMDGTYLAENAARYMETQFPYVEETFNSNSIHGVDGYASDMTADFCCRLLAGRI